MGSFSYTPANGLNNKTTFPTVPTSGDALRASMQTLLDQIAAYAAAKDAEETPFDQSLTIPRDNVQDAIDYVYEQLAEYVSGGIPDSSITSDKMVANMKRAVAGGLATYDETLNLIEGVKNIVGKNLINILRLKLQQALGTADIDAWSDPFEDSLLIDTSVSSKYARVNSPTLGTFLRVEALTESANAWMAFGISTHQKAASLFYSGTLTPLTLARPFMYKTGNPTDDVVCELWDATLTSKLATATNTINGVNIGDSIATYPFYFDNVPLEPSTGYHLVLYGTGEPNDSNYYNIGRTNTSLSPGMVKYYNGSSWATLNYYSANNIYGGPATVIWKAVTATEALRVMAVVMDETTIVGHVGTATFYLSDNGEDWTEVSLDTIQEVNFTLPSVYLKCVFTHDMGINSVAYGGY